MYEQTIGGCRVVDALLTTSTNVERLFSYAGMVLEDRRARLNSDKLNQIVFLRENIVLANFQLDWD